MSAEREQERHFDKIRLNAVRSGAKPLGVDGGNVCRTQEAALHGGEELPDLASRHEVYCRVMAMKRGGRTVVLMKRMLQFRLH